MTSSRIIFSNGCFDILHRGHIEMLQYAASLGDYLVVALDTDSRVKQNKSFDRPINCLEDRMFMMQALSCVDMVHSFSSQDELRRLMKAYNPEYLVIGEEYEDRHIIGKDLVKEVKFFRKTDGYSTTKTIERITNR